DSDAERMSSRLSLWVRVRYASDVRTCGASRPSARREWKVSCLLCAANSISSWPNAANVRSPKSDLHRSSEADCNEPRSGARKLARGTRFFACAESSTPLQGIAVQVRRHFQQGEFPSSH